MPPSSSRRVGLRSRRDTDSHQQSDADTPDSIATPSRKRRRVGSPNTDLSHNHNRSLSGARPNGFDNANNNTAPSAASAAEDVPRARTSESMSNDSNATLPNAADDEFPVDPFERQNLIIGSLRTPREYIPHATYDYANDLQARRTEGRNIEAYAKIAARDWCFFVRKTVLLIGRSDASTRPNPPTSSQDVASAAEEEEDPVDQWGIDIDLGPNRQVSRVHAQIDFDPGKLKWYITVNSRNGLKLDDRSIEKGSREPLHSGICIGLLGTQMLFLLASGEDHFHPLLWRQVKQGPDMEGESDKEGNPPSRALPHAHPSGVTPRRENYDPFPPLSHPRSKPGSQGLGHQLTSTPGRLPDTPLAIRSSEKDPRSKGSPWFSSRGMMIDGAEDIDYSDDTARDIKPPHSYAQLIGQAILSSPEQMLTLANIYGYIKERYAFFRHTNAGWQNSIRHNLSLSKSFEKVARRTDEPGKGMKWKIVDAERDEFLKKQIYQPRKGAPPLRLDSSGPNSPAMNNQPAHATERLVEALGQPPTFGKQEPRSAPIKSPPRSATPPLVSYPVATESFTPDRGPRPQNPFGRAKQSPPPNDLAKFATPAKRLFHDSHGPGTNTRRKPGTRGHRDGDNEPSSPNGDPSKSNVTGMRDHSANSPPTLYSDHAGHNPNGLTQGGLVTPLVARQAPRLAPPSTSQVPSQYMNFSSPAPFWKYVDLPSTPARGLQLDVSPIKLKPSDNGENNPETEPAQPSSPPILNVPGDAGEDNNEDDEADDNENDKDEELAPESPTRTVSRPVSRAHVHAPPRSRSNSNVNGFGAPSGGMVRGASLGSFDEAEEEGEFDLAKGFQKIGSFHRNMQTHTSIPQQPQDGHMSS